MTAESGAREARETGAEDGGHTPGPWHVEQGEYGALITAGAGGSFIAVWPEDLLGNKYPFKANARRIVQCANAHDDLVSVVERFVALFSWQIENSAYEDASGNKLVSDARAALAKARGETP